MTNDTPRPERRPPYLVRVILARPRLATSAMLGIAVIALLPSGMLLSRRLLIGWDAGIALYLVLTVTAALASLGAILAELGVSQGGGRTPVQLALATTTIVLSWAFTHTMFALHYAHDYYGEQGAKQSGLNFPGDEEPDYWDFVYFSFVIGMTSQVSDVAITSKAIRQTATAHGIVSFIFNATLLALTVNIAASVITS
jgi:uncharacterized membrane protein